MLSLLGAVIATSPGCKSGPKLPDKSSKEYGDVVSAFYVGLAALQVGDDVHADSRLSEVTRLVPGEPAGWANWGILALRQRNYDAAGQRLQSARDLAPNNDHIYDLLGILESQRGNSAQAIADLRKAADLNPQNLRAIYQLAEETERQSATNSDCRIPGAYPENSRSSARQSGGAAGIEPYRCETRRCRHSQVRRRSNQRPLGGVAVGSAAPAGGGSVCRRRSGPARCRDPDHVPAQRAGAGARIPSQSQGDQSRARRRS